MKNSNHLTKLALSLAAPALCAWLFAGREFSVDLLFGAYTLAGLFFLTAADYTPRRPLPEPRSFAKYGKRWVRTSLSRPARTRAARKTEEIPA